MNRDLIIRKLMAMDWSSLPNSTLETVFDTVAGGRTNAQTGPELSLDDFAERLYRRHPKKKNRVLSQHALIRLVERYPKEQIADMLLQIEKSHAAWCLTPNWREKNGSYAPPLADWLEDEAWRDMPAGVGASQGGGLFSSLIAEGGKA